MKISDAIKRFDFDEKVEGRARFCADISCDGMLYARTLRSEKARAVITSIDIPDLPEGYFIVDNGDIPGSKSVPMVFNDQPYFARGRVNYIGEPILLVVGPEKQAILDILKNIRVSYQELKPVANLAEAELPQDEYIFEEQPFFVEYEYSKGDTAAAIERSRFFIEDEFATGYQEQAYLETQSMLGVYEDGCVTVYGSMQCPYYIKGALEAALGWSGDRVRVVQLPTGGGFGGKEEYPSIIGVHAGLAAIKAKRPVKLVLDRQEDIMASTKRHPAVIRIRSYIDEQDRITAREIDIKTDGGAYAGLSSVVLQRLMFSVCGVYNIENLKVRGRAYATNNVVSGAFRGFGGPQAFFAIEMHMENIAQRLNQDPLEMKRRYFLQKGDTSSNSGLFQYDIRLGEIADRIDQLSGYSQKRARKDQDGRLYGIGFSLFYHGCGFTGNSEETLLKPKVRLKKHRDGTVQVFVSSTEIGQGALTTLRKIVAQALGIPVELVIHEYPDTLVCPDSGPTVASRTVMIVGKLLHDCALKMKEQWAEEEFEVSHVYVYPKNLNWDNDIFLGNAYPEFSWGANVVEVEVDPVTYVPNILGIWAVYDIGTPIDEKIVKGQIDGGIVQGLGFGCMEVLNSQGGRLLQGSFTDYLIPTAVDFPKIESRLIHNPYPDGPLGARGLGEMSLVGAAPALALAVQSAISRKVRRIPITPEYIMELMQGDE